MLLPQMLSQLIFASIPNSMALVASRYMTEISCLVNTMNGGFMANAVCVAFEGYWAGKLSAEDGISSRLLLGWRHGGWPGHELGRLVEDWSEVVEVLERFKHTSIEADILLQRSKWIKIATTQSWYGVHHVTSTVKRAVRSWRIHEPKLALGNPSEIIVEGERSLDGRRDAVHGKILTPSFARQPLALMVGRERMVGLDIVESSVEAEGQVLGSWSCLRPAARGRQG